MKAIKILGFVVSIGALIYYGYRLFGKPNGNEYEVDKHHHVYYKGDDVTKDDARKVADYLKESGSYTDSNEMDVEIKSEKSNELTIRFIVDKDKVTPESSTEILQFFGNMGAKVFPGKSIHVILADEHLDDIKDLGIATGSQPQTNTNTQ